MPELTQKARIEHLLPGKYCYFCLHPNPQKIISPNRILFECLKCGRMDGVQLKIDQRLKSDWYHEQWEHFTIGALMYNTKTKKYLLMKKRTFPLVIDVVAGHILATETPEQTLVREVKEETGISIDTYTLLCEGIQENDLCRRGATAHYWYLYLAPFSGVPVPHVQEVAYFQEYTLEEILAEKILNPPVRAMLAGLSTSLLTP